MALVPPDGIAARPASADTPGQSYAYEAVTLGVLAIFCYLLHSYRSSLAETFKVVTMQLSIEKAFAEQTLFFRQFLTLSSLWGILLVVLLFKGIGIVLLEFRHLITERRLLGILELPPGDRAGMMFQAIRHSLLFFGISIHPGWNCGKTEARLSRILLDYEPGLYTRVNELMEKYYYGGEVLKEYELRLLYRFLTMIRSSRKNLTLLERFRMRYDL